MVAGRRQPTQAVVIGALGLAGAAVIGGAMQGMPTLDFDGVTPIQGLGQLVLYGITALLRPAVPDGARSRRPGAQGRRQQRGPAQAQRSVRLRGARS